MEYQCDAFTQSVLSRHYPAMDQRGRQCSRRASVAPDAYGRRYCKQHATTHGVYSKNAAESWRKDHQRADGSYDAEMFGELREVTA